MSKCRYDLSEDCNNTNCLNCVLDKIRAEIEQKRIGYPPNAEYYWAIKECLQIIDKYKAESEVEV